MTPERWGEVKAVLDRMLPLDAAGREAALAELPADLRRDVEPYLQTDLGPIAELLPTDVGGGSAASVPTPQADVVEVLAGRYRLVERVGRGGMGAVWRAHDLKLDRPVAVKRLHDAWLEDREARARLLAEGRALAALNHPGVARVEDVLDSSPPALVLEYVEGGTLGRWLEAPRAAGDVIDVLRQVVEAVAYAHGRGVVHCDLKPGNVLVTPDGRVKVIDLGIALMRHRAATTSTVVDDSTRHPAFTPKYAAPEVLRGATPTSASDVFSLGVLIQDVLAATAEAGVPLPRSVASPLIGVALRAMAADPAGRYPDASALLDALPPLPGRESRPAQWRALATTTLVVVGGCMSAGVGMFGDPSVVSLSAASRPVLGVVTRIDAASANSLSAVAADLVRQAIAPVKRARLVSRSFATAETSEQGIVEAVRHEGLTYVIVPSVATTGSRVRVSVMVLRAADGRLVRTITRFGSEGEVARLCREASDEIRWWLGEGVQPPTRQQYEPTTLSLAQYSEARRYTSRPDQKGSLERARDLLMEVILREPGFTAAHAQLGRVYYLMYRERPEPLLIAHALESVLTAVNQDPDLAETRIALATVHQMRGRRAEALVELQRVLEAAPENDEALQLSGRLEAAEGHVDAGLDLLKRAVELVPSWANYQALGGTYYRFGRYREAAEVFETVTRLQPDNAWGFQNHGVALHRLGRLEEAAAAYRSSIALNPIGQAVSNLATLEYSRGNLEEAARLYTQAITLEPHEPAYARNLADVQRELGRRDDALQAYAVAVAAATKLLVVNRDDVGPLSTLAYAQARLATCRESAAASQATEAAAQGAPAPLANVLNAYVLCGELARARGLMRRLKAAGHDVSTMLERDVQAVAMKDGELRALLSP